MKATIEKFGDKFKITNSFGETAYLKTPIYAGESATFDGPNGPVTRQIGEIEIVPVVASRHADRRALKMGCDDRRSSGPAAN